MGLLVALVSGVAAVTLGADSARRVFLSDDRGARF
jgi:hypothetical protein